MDDTTTPADLWEWKRLVEESEKSLVLGHYETSEYKSIDILKNLDVSDESLKERAAIVFVQSVFETQQFSKARGVLCSSFSSLEKAPANVILLWISLALETEDRRQADSLILALLKSKGSRQSGWTREQYLTLVHMYATDILLPTLKDPSEVHLWFRRQTFIPLDPRELQFLEDQVSGKVIQTTMPVITPMGSMTSSVQSPIDDKQSSLFFSPRTSHSFDRDRPYDLGIDLTPVELLEYTNRETQQQQQQQDSLLIPSHDNATTISKTAAGNLDPSSVETPDHLDILGHVQKLFFHAIGMKIHDSSSRSRPTAMREDTTPSPCTIAWSPFTIGLAAAAALVPAVLATMLHTYTT